MPDNSGLVTNTDLNEKIADVKKIQVVGGLVTNTDLNTKIGEVKKNSVHDIFITTTEFIKC